MGNGMQPNKNQIMSELKMLRHRCLINDRKQWWVGKFLTLEKVAAISSGFYLCVVVSSTVLESLSVAKIAKESHCFGLGVIVWNFCRSSILAEFHGEPFTYACKWINAADVSPASGTEFIRGIGFVWKPRAIGPQGLSRCFKYGGEAVALKLTTILGSIWEREFLDWQTLMFVLNLRRIWLSLL